MIIVRHKDAKKLSSVLATDTDNMNFASMIDKAKMVDIIYFDKRINVVTFKNKFAPTLGTIAELEKRNLPFIILLDKKSEIAVSRLYTGVINADCITYDTLECCFPERDKLTIKDNKSLLLNQLITDYVEYDECATRSNFRDSFYEFVGASQVNEVFTKDVLFLAMDAKTGDILNANEPMGKLHDDDKVWVFSEEYIYDGEEEEEMVIDVVDKVSVIYEFTWLYETQNASFSMAKMKEMTVHEITEIITKYPKFFTDILKRKVSQYTPNTFIEFADKYEEETEEVTESEYRFLNGLSEHQMRDMEICYACENLLLKDQTIMRHVRGKLRTLCDDCAEVFPGVEFAGVVGGF